MKTLVDSKQMKAIDSYTIEQIGIPAMVLMERAALSVAEVVKSYASMKDKILAVCGCGNNGADGIATARILSLQGYQIDILIVDSDRFISDQAKQQLDIAKNLGISVYNNIKINEYTIIIDSIFGIGLSKPVEGIYKDIIEEINTGNQTVIAVDIPSGLSADTAKPMNVAVKADYTVTFGVNKIGLVLYPGYEYAGKVTVVDIGFPQLAIDIIKPNCMTYDYTDINRLPHRKEYSNKGSFGKVLVIAGSFNMSGACYLSAKAAYRTGAGLVKLLTVAENRTIMQMLLPEAILSTYSSDSNMDDLETEKILNEIEWATVVVIGPGIGVSDKSEKLLDLVIKNIKVPLIIDADGVNILANKIHRKSCSLEDIVSNLPEQTVLTPHLKELSGIIGMSIEEITKDFIGAANICTNGNRLIFALKDARTLVAYENTRYINTSGNNGMATGGSGDVLTGIIAALIAQGLVPNEATVLGVYIHGLAGDQAAKKKGNYALIASDIVDAIADVCI